MSFGMFVTWVLVGVLAGVLAELVTARGGYGLKNDVMLGVAGSIGASWLFRGVGVVADAGILLMVFVAAAGAALAIAGQRRFMATGRPVAAKGAMWRWGAGAALLAAVAWLVLVPSAPPPAAAPVIEDRTYAVTPPSMTVTAGALTGEITDMRITERVEQGSGRIDTAAKLTARLLLKNATANQTVRLVGGKIRYIDGDGQPIALEDARGEPVVRFRGTDRLDPGQETTESLDVEFPAAALKAKALKEIRLELAYVPSAFREETVNVVVAIEGPK
jgi:uncharacterized membrane protein YeaQ/YmgE (transglycosylase-associated protein family)